MPTSSSVESLSAWLCADLRPSSLPTAIVVSHLSAVGFISFVAGRSIYRSYVALRPSSATRHREPLRKGHVQLFSILAFVSLALTGYYASRFGSLSYRVWATERGVELPNGYVITFQELFDSCRSVPSRNFQDTSWKVPVMRLLQSLFRKINCHSDALSIEADC